jgi:hypothetical protein
MLARDPKAFNLRKGEISSLPRDKSETKKKESNPNIDFTFNNNNGH